MSQFSVSALLVRLLSKSCKFATLAKLVLLLGFGSTIHANAQNFQVVHLFDIEDACDPIPTADAGNPAYSGILAQGLDGNLYGTTPGGGTCGNNGTVYQMTGNGSVTLLYNFPFNEGAKAVSGLTLAPDGYLYGTTYYGGVHGIGSIFKIKPAGINSTLVTLHDFNGSDGEFPSAPPILARDGNFYGTTTQGSTDFYKMTPAGKLTSYALAAVTNPVAPVMQAADGNFYGTAQGGGTRGGGAVFRVTSGGASSLIYSFDGSTGINGYAPVGPVIQGNDGNFYGTTSAGGNSLNDQGVVFKLTPSGKITLLHVFTGPDGGTPYGGLIQASDGSFYGVTSAGGTTGDGTLYKLTPQGKSFVFSTLVNFDRNSNGQSPQLTLLQHTSGVVYGDSNSGGPQTEESGGPYLGVGTFYSLSDTALTPFASVIPTGAKAGASVTILGQGFTGATTVSFNGAPATVTSHTPTYLTATVPSAGVTGTVTVTTGSTVLKSNKPFIVIPAIISFSPTSGKDGDQVVIQGSGFTGASQVTFGGVKATIFTVNSGTKITATVPTGAKTGKITVKTAGGTAVSPGTFTVLP